MCGIAGVFSLAPAAGPPVDEDTLRRMTDVIRYRGPDDVGHELHAGMALGARRLSIIDLAGGHQPMCDESRRVWAAQNGEIYNHNELRNGLKARGHRFQTRCDTEVLPHLYQEGGARLPESLRGKFAIAAWDTERAEGVLARDRTGVKPLYYALAGDRVVFGSELKCVLASGLVDTELDMAAISAYLALGYFPAPMTPLAHVRKLGAGERLVIAAGEARVESYWDYPQAEREGAGDERDWARRLLDVLEESVVARLMSDVPLGAMLSGGLDSSLIVALMARNMDRPVDTFAVGFEGDARGNELADARRVADALGTNHRELELTAGDAPRLEELIWHLDEPIADLSSLGFFALSRLAAEHVTVALSGQGADELLGGYQRHTAAALADSWERIVPGPVGRPIAGAAQRLPGRAGTLARALGATDPVSRFLGSTGLVRDDLRRELLTDRAEALTDSARLAVAGALPPGIDGLDAALHLDAVLGMPESRLHYFDRCSMAHSLEVRVPFLDHHVVEFCSHIPGKLLFERLRGKRVLRTAARGLVPDSVLEKPKLGFFSESLGGWLMGHGKPYVDGLLMREDLRCAAILEPAAISATVSGWRQGTPSLARPVLALLMLELWLEEYLPAGQGLAEAARVREVA